MYYKIKVEFKTGRIITMEGNEFHQMEDEIIIFKDEKFESGYKTRKAVHIRKAEILYYVKESAI